MSSPRQIPSAVITELATVVAGEQSFESVLQRVAELVRETIAGVDDASITLIRGQKAYTAAFCDADAFKLDERQYEAGYGPCLDAAASGEILGVPDTSGDETYPDFASAAAHLGIRTTLTVPLQITSATIGAINLYGRSMWPDADTLREQAGIFASYAAAAVANTARYADAIEETEQLRRAMASRAVIEQAKGILIRDTGCSPDEAFHMLRKASNRANRKLRDIAEALIQGAQRST